MSQTTPEIESILDNLTTLCCEALTSDRELDTQRVIALTKSLSANGWDRHSEKEAPLGTIIERRVREQCPEPSIHRGAALESVAKAVQQAYDKASRYDNSTPQDKQDHQKEASTQSHPTVG